MSVCMTSWGNLMEIVWWELNEILSFSKKKWLYAFCDQKTNKQTETKSFSLFGISFFFFFFLVSEALVHAKLIIGRLPSFMFPGSFDSMVSVARQKLLVNMVDLSISWTYFGKQTVALIVMHPLWAFLVFSTAHNSALMRFLLLSKECSRKY